MLNIGLFAFFKSAIYLSNLLSLLILNFLVILLFCQLFCISDIFYCITVNGQNLLTLGDAGPHYSHLKYRKAIPVQSTAITIIMMTETITFSVLCPREAAFSNFIPCVRGRIFAALCMAAGMIS